jgi:hypothetical protein
VAKRLSAQPVRRVQSDRATSSRAEGDEGFPSRLIRPKSDLWVSAWVAFTTLTLPIFGALYMISVASGWWIPFAGAHVTLILLFTLTAWRLKDAGILLAPDGIREREYLSRMVFTPVAVIASVVVIRLRDSNSDAVSQQMFIVDAAGRTLLRMRGPMWHAEDLHRVIDYYAIPIRVVDSPMTWSELRRSRYGRNLTGWERHPLATIVGVVVAFVGVMIPALVAVLPVISVYP